MHGTLYNARASHVGIVQEGVDRNAELGGERFGFVPLDVALQLDPVELVKSAGGQNGAGRRQEEPEREKRGDLKRA